VKLQEQIPEISKLDAEIIAIATAGNQQDVEKSKRVLEITYSLIPTPNGEVVEEYGLETDSSGGAYATYIIDKKGKVRFKGADDRATRTPASSIIKELQLIQ
jgi:peroxiredoxin